MFKNRPSFSSFSHPGWKEVTRTPSWRSSTAKLAETMFKADLEQRYAYMPSKYLFHLFHCRPAHGSDTSPTLPAMEDIWMMAAFSTPIALLVSKLAALFNRGRRALARRRVDITSLP